MENFGIRGKNESNFINSRFSNCYVNLDKLLFVNDTTMIAEAVLEKKFLPCPFCGSTRVKVEATHSKQKIYFVLCVTCLARGGESEKASTAIHWWNTRTGKGN
jgi:Lar family restriction alleviation protein